METTPHPDGYPKIGLTAKSLPLRYRYDANLTRLTRRLERWEADRGNTSFWISGLDRVPGQMAFELANVLVGLREWHPTIKPDHIAFNSTLDPDTMAEATTYATAYPRLRVAAAEGIDVATLDEDELDEEMLAELQALSEEINGTDIASSGNISMSRFICSLGGQKAMVRFWRMRNEVRARNRRPQRLPEIVTTPGAFTLTHEFGHLVDSELCADGWQAAEPVYRVLSEILLGVSDPDPRQWRNHLINYPTDDLTAAGPVQGGKTRQKATIKTLTVPIATTLGSYAAVNRDELFAESFALAYCGPVELRRKLRPFLTALEDAGLRRARRR